MSTLIQMTVILISKRPSKEKVQEEENLGKKNLQDIF